MAQTLNLFHRGRGHRGRGDFTVSAQRLVGGEERRCDLGSGQDGLGYVFELRVGGGFVGGLDSDHDAIGAGVEEVGH